MGVLKSKHGVYYVRKKVPAKLEQAVSTVLGVPRSRVSWLKRSLRTKDLREANIRAKPVLMEFDRILASAAGLLQDAPLRTDLSEVEIERIADYQYASMLEEDEEVRRDGTGSEELFQNITKQLREAGVPSRSAFRSGTRPAFGLSDREMGKIEESIDGPLALAKAALARGDISFVRGRTGRTARRVPHQPGSRQHGLPAARYGGLEALGAGPGSNGEAPQGRGQSRRPDRSSPPMTNLPRRHALSCARRLEEGKAAYADDCQRVRSCRAAVHRAARRPAHRGHHAPSCARVPRSPSSNTRPSRGGAAKGEPTPTC